MDSHQRDLEKPWSERFLAGVHNPCEHQPFSEGCHRPKSASDQGNGGSDTFQTPAVVEWWGVCNTPTTGSTITSRPDLEETWRQLEEVGQWTGHVLVRCPGCSSRAMVSILNGSGTSRWVKSGGGWPRCKQCIAAPRVEPVGDVDAVLRVQPGHHPKPRVLKAFLKKRGQIPDDSSG